MIKIRIKGDLQKEIEASVKKAKDAIVTKAIDALQAATPVDTGYAESRWIKDSKGNIINDAEYIEQLNQGHSKQAPAYFIEQTLLTQPGLSAGGTIVRSQ